MTQKEIIQQIPVDQGSLGYFVPRRGSTQREALATQREKSIPHVKLINNFFFQRVRSNPAYVLESYRCKLSFLFGFNDLALKTKKLLISVTLLTFFNEPHLKIPVLTVFWP